MNVGTLRMVGDILTVGGILCNLGSSFAANKVMQVEIQQGTAMEVSRQLHDVSYAEQVEAFRQKAIRQLAEQREHHKF